VNTTQVIRVIGVDPGTTKSGVACYNLQTKSVEWSNGEMPNDQVLLLIRASMTNPETEIALERIAAIYGGVVGGETIKTIMFCGRVIQCAWPRIIRCLSPQEIRTAICGTAKAKDAGVTQALKDRIGDKGTKKNPGPTFGVSSHAWRGLAVAYASTLVPTHTE
jgi:Holliday junction resolvasome RuvABC endonuclease subunit